MRQSRDKDGERAEGSGRHSEVGGQRREKSAERATESETARKNTTGGRWNKKRSRE